jgi:hypothetical protein
LWEAHGGSSVGKMKGMLNVSNICLLVLRQRHSFFPATPNDHN